MAYQRLFEVITVRSFQVVVLQNFRRSMDSSITSSPQYPQSNGEAERGVQTVKNLLKKACDPYKPLLHYRSTPLEGIGLSPSQLMMNRRLKSTLPVKKSLLMAENAEEIKQALEKQKRVQKTI